MRPAEITVGTGDFIAACAERVSAMDEVVVTAMGIRREESVGLCCTGSKGREFNRCQIAGCEFFIGR